MICLKCGSREVESSNDAKLKVIYAECLRCQHKWEQEYDPWWKPPEEDKKG